MSIQQTLMLTAAVLMIVAGLIFIALENYTQGAIFASLGASFAAISSVYGAKAKKKDETDAG